MIIYGIAKRERELLELLPDNEYNLEKVARIMGISDKTAKDYARNCIGKLGLKKKYVHVSLTNSDWIRIRKEMCDKYFTLFPRPS